jgi:hypothetical protein
MLDDLGATDPVEPFCEEGIQNKPNRNDNKQQRRQYFYD